VPLKAGTAFALLVLPSRVAFLPGIDPENAMKYEMLMLRSLLVTSMLICGLTLGQMF
jgi:hypothetical protein